MIFVDADKSGKSGSVCRVTDYLARLHGLLQQQQQQPRGRWG